MIKVIDSKATTRRPQKIAATPQHSTRTQWIVHTATLYRTNKGNWFTHYKPSRTRAMQGDAPRIEPITETAAKAFAMEHNLIETLDAYFSDTIEDA